MGHELRLQPATLRHVPQHRPRTAVWTAEGHKVFMEHNTLQEAHAAHIAAKGIDESKLNPAQKKQLDTSVKKAYEQAEKDARKEYEESLWVPLNEAGDLPPGPPGFKSQLTDEERAKWRRGEFEGGPNVDIMQRFKPHTDPYDFYRLFLPAELVKEEVKHTNAYAVYQSAGTDVYMPKHVPFFTDELEKGEGLLLRNGIHPLPDLNFMFTDTRKDWARPRPGARAAMAPTPVRAAHARRCSTSPA